MAQRHQSPPSLWLITPAEGLVHFIRDDCLLPQDTCPGLQDSGPSLHLPEQRRDSHLARGAVGSHFSPMSQMGKAAPGRLRPPRSLVGCQKQNQDSAGSCQCAAKVPMCQACCSLSVGSTQAAPCFSVPSAVFLGSVHPFISLLCHLFPLP